MEAGDQKAGVRPGSEDEGWVEWLVESGAVRRAGSKEADDSRSRDRIRTEKETQTKAQ